MPAGQQRELRGRERELGEIRGLLDRLSGGSGQALVFEGALGMGKSRLLHRIREEAPAHGTGVLHARGGEFETDFAWGVVRQLFGPLLSAASVERRRELFSGPARLASSLFDYRRPVTADLHQTLYGIYWMCRNLSERQPLVIVVDDVHWADAESMRMLVYLANRLEDLPVGLVVATVPLEDVPRCELLTAASTSSRARLIPLQPLPPAAVRALAADVLRADPEDAFTIACHGATQGNPLFLDELLAELAMDRIDPVASAAERVWRTTPRRVVVDVMGRLNRLPKRLIQLARAVAVLGPEAEPRHCARVAELGEAEATAAAGALVEARILRAGFPYAFSHRAIQNVVYDGIPVRECHRAHRRAASVLCAADAEASVIASHLLRIQPEMDGWVVEVLREAASGALLEGAPSSAVDYLRRALAEPPGDAVRPQVLAELGSAELRARHRTAAERLTEALHRVTDPPQRQRIRLDLGQALIAAGRYKEAVDVWSEAARGGGGTDDGLVTQVRSALLVAPHLVAGEPPAGPASPWLRPRQTRVARAHAAAEALRRGRPADRVTRLAASALSGGLPLGEHDVALPPACLAAWTLAQGGRPGDAGKALSGIEDEARRKRQVLAAATATAMRAMVLLETGCLAASERAARSVLRDQQADSLPVAGVPLAAAALVQVLIELDEATKAPDVLERLEMAGPLPAAGLYLPVRMARGRLSIVLGELEEGAGELMECRRLALEWGWRHPTLDGGCLADLTSALMRAGKEHRCRTLLRAELERARAFQAPRPLASVLHAYGLIDGSAGLEDLAEAARLLDGSPAALEHARVLIDLGSAMRRSGQRAGARRHLLAGLELATECGAVVLMSQVRSELRLAGVRPRASQRTAPTSLTPAEQRVAAKAVAGLTNKEIAQALFVTVKTVEWHLSQTYRKLGISRRSELTRHWPGSPERR